MKNKFILLVAVVSASANISAMKFDHEQSGIVTSKKSCVVEYVKPKKIRSKWTEIEDIALIEAVKTLGRQWDEVAKYIKVKNERQCRERYNYYLDRQINNDPWTTEEDLLLIQKADEYNHKWSYIAPLFKNRTWIN